MNSPKALLVLAALAGCRHTYTAPQNISKSLSLDYIIAFTNGHLNGSSWLTSTLNPRNGHRESAATAYLEPAVSRPNLHIFDNTLGECILFDKEKVARGLQVTTANRTYTLAARREAIVSGGAFQSPHLLLVSGVRPAGLLREHGFEVVADRPGVGQNLQDHVFFGITYRLNVATASALQYRALAVAEFNADGTGPLASPGGDFDGYEKLPQGLRTSFAPAMLAELARLPADWPVMQYLTLPTYVGNFETASTGSPQDGYMYATLLATLIAPSSRGNISISSPHMADQPLINPNRITTQHDIDVAIRGFKRLRQILTSRAITNVTIGPEYYPGSQVQTDKQIYRQIQDSFNTMYHAASSCKMPKRSDPYAVVDSHARLYGVRNLRVVDISAFPSVTPGLPHRLLFKKKCDEVRPSCSRCAERGLDCAYEPVKPRQRRKRTSNDMSTVTSELDRRTSFASTRRWSYSSNSSAQHDLYNYHCLGDLKAQSDQLFSPLDCTFDAISLSTIADLGYPTSPETMTESAVEFDEDDHAEVARTPFTSQAVAQVSKASALTNTAVCPLGSPLLDFYMPAFFEFSDQTNRRALVDHFCNSLSHLIVFREERGNPFQELVLPLTSRSSPVMNAIYALASAHMEYRGVKNKEQSLYFHGEAIQGLAALIDQKARTAENRNELLAAIMLLVYYEVLVQKGRSNLVDGHLKGAMTIMNSYPTATDPTGIFLERAFRFYDVIAALSFGTAPLSQAPGKGCLHPFPPPGTLVTSSLSSVDTLLGMATSLWPIIHRLSKLSSDKKELKTACRDGQASSMIAVLKTECETNAHAIERALESWQPYLPPGFSPDEPPSPEMEDGRNDLEMAEKYRLHSIFNNAMAYRHSAFVYLYHSIYGYPRTHASVQKHAHAALWHCLQTCSNAGPMGALLWPLFVASCEAVTDADRELARESFQLVEKRQGMINIKWAWDIVQEVWRLADAMEKEGDDGQPTTVEDCTVTAGCSTPDLWRKVSKQMGISIVFG
ncbi:hypothetical protein VPNG_08655 [Cytospora leucostoma]|uniref:Glucose-methanol-choline oxidoreductase N-terminal domain-containing protein n=1 Tax=Cytospora leucostoma TaxID=1230097 RepID=A0A423W3A4_9PEZI|nr:hypothetical protein VPNG_08655 [Cytospora leucostoma]